jgi:hypothetical protein
MTAEEWARSSDVTAMLTSLEGKVSERKLRLFAVACCWRVWPLLTDGRSRKAVKVAARYADGLATERERTDAYLAARTASDEMDETIDRDGALRLDASPARHAAIAARNAVGVFRTASDLSLVASPAVRARRAAAASASLARRVPNPSAWIPAVNAEKAAQAALLRDLVGPLRPSALAPWRSPTILSIAQHAYEARDFVALAILADALEDEGCELGDILTHCRQPGEHARGCWVLDGLLGKE